MALDRYAGAYERLGVRHLITVVDGELLVTTELTGALADLQQGATPPPYRLRALDQERFATRINGLGNVVVFQEFEQGRPQYFFAGRVARRTSLSARPAGQTGRGPSRRLRFGRPVTRIGWGRARQLDPRRDESPGAGQRGHVRNSPLSEDAGPMTVDLRGRSFVKELDFTADELLFLLGLARDLKAAKGGGYERRATDGKNIALDLRKDFYPHPLCLRGRRP